MVYISSHRTRRSYFRAFTTVNRLLKFVNTPPPQEFWFRAVLQNLCVVLFPPHYIYDRSIYFPLFFVTFPLHLSLPSPLFISLLHLCLFFDRSYSVDHKFVQFLIRTPFCDSYRFSRLVRNLIAVMVYFTVGFIDTYSATVYAVQ